MITALAVENYRSLRHLVLPVERLNVVTGANGSGKSSLYRALRLLADAARNGAVAALAREGGLASTLWAGSPRSGRSLREGHPPVQGGAERRLLLGFADDDFGYAALTTDQKVGGSSPSEYAQLNGPFAHRHRRSC